MKTYLAVPAYILNILSSLIEIRPLSKEIARHTRNVLTDNGRTDLQDR